MAVIEAAVACIQDRQEEKAQSIVIAADVKARELCRLFALGEKSRVLSILLNTDQLESSLIVAMACNFMADGVRKDFVSFVTQAMTLLR